MNIKNKKKKSCLVNGSELVPFIFFFEMLDDLGLDKIVFGKDLIKQIQIENLIFEGKNENFEEIKKLISNFNKIYLQKLIIQAAHPLKYKFYADLFALTGPLQIFISPYQHFPRYLQKKEIIDKPVSSSIKEPTNIVEVSVEECENPIS